MSDDPVTQTVAKPMPMSDQESALATRIAERTGRWPLVASTMVRYFYRTSDGTMASRDIEYGGEAKARRRIEALRTALLYARRDHLGPPL